MSTKNMLREPKCLGLREYKRIPHVGNCYNRCIPRYVSLQRVIQPDVETANLKLTYSVSRHATAQAIICRASTSPAISPAPRNNSKLKRSIWTAVDVLALLGSVGGALAALLGVVSPTYALTLPLVLPVVSLIAALQREDLTNEEGRQYLSELSSSLGRDSAVLLKEAAAAIDEVRREARGQSATAARLAALEDKLAVLEGAVVGAARNSREAAVGVNALGSALQQNFAALASQQSGSSLPLQTSQLLAGMVSSEVVPLVKAELSGVLGPWLADSHAALRRLDTRLAVVEGSLAGLEQAQTDSLMRLGSSLNSSLTDAQAALQSLVRVEVATAVEPLKQLPQMVTAAAARALQQREMQLVPEGADQQQLTASSVVNLPSLLPELKELVAAEVAAATQQILNQQSELMLVLSQPPRPTPLTDDQWEALGRRLSRLERLVQSLPELGEQAVAAQLAPVLAAQQAAAEAQQMGITDVTGNLTDVTQSVARLENIMQGGAGVAADDSRLGLIVENLSRVQQQLEVLSNLVVTTGQVATDEDRDDLSRAVKQVLQQLQQQVQSGQGPTAAVGASEVTDLLYSLQQQVQGVAAALQQVHMDIPVQVGLAVNQLGSNAGSNGYNANGNDTAAAQGIAEVQQVLTAIQQLCEGLRMQVGALAAEIAAQQTAVSNQNGQQPAAAMDNTAVLAVAEQQLSITAASISDELSQQMRQLCENLQQQLQELQQQLAASAAAAASQAAGDAVAAAAAAAAANKAGTVGSTDVYPLPSPSDGLEEQQQHMVEIERSSGFFENKPQPVLQQTYEQSSAPAAAAAAYPPYQQQQQPPAPAAADVVGAEVAADSTVQAASWPGYLGPQSTRWPNPQAAQQQQFTPTAAAAAAAVQPTLQPLQTAIIPDPALLSDEQLRSEGLRLLRSGREATRGTGNYAASGPDFAAAETQLQAAVACFSRAVELEPQDTRALGNLGNALLAQGELKKGLLDELMLNAAQGGLGLEGAQSLRIAEARLRSEASTLLTRAGEIFRRVLEVDGWSSRALVNWGKAMVGRAELSADTSAAIKLYNAAIDKFEAVLEEDPGMVVAKYRCALAMQGLAALNPDNTNKASVAGTEAQSPRQQLVLLTDAYNYLSDVVKTGAGGDEGLREAAAGALRQVQQQLEMVKLTRK